MSIVYFYKKDIFIKKTTNSIIILIIIQKIIGNNKMKKNKNNYYGKISDNEILLNITNHAMERFFERHYDIAKAINFQDDFYYNNNSWKINAFLMSECFKRAYESKIHINNTSFQVHMLESYGDEYGKGLRVFSFGDVVFVCKENEEKDELTIITVVGKEYKYAITKNIDYEIKQKNFVLNQNKQEIESIKEIIANNCRTNPFVEWNKNVISVDEALNKKTDVYADNISKSEMDYSRLSINDLLWELGGYEQIVHIDNNKSIILADYNNKYDLLVVEDKSIYNIIDDFENFKNKDNEEKISLLNARKLTKDEHLNLVYKSLNKNNKDFIKVTNKKFKQVVECLSIPELHELIKDFKEKEIINLLFSNNHHIKNFLNINDVYDNTDIKRILTNIENDNDDVGNYIIETNNNEVELVKINHKNNVIKQIYLENYYEILNKLNIDELDLNNNDKKIVNEFLLKKLSSIENMEEIFNHLLDKNVISLNKNNKNNDLINYQTNNFDNDTKKSLNVKIDKNNGKKYIYR